MIAGDNGEQVVEVVSDAAGKLAESFHALGDAERLLALEFFGHVADHADPAHHTTVCFSHDAAANHGGER